MDPRAVATRYFDGWSGRDPEAIAATFAADGTFSDPAGDRSAPRIGAHARQLFERFPELAFEVQRTEMLDTGVVVGRWTMRVGDADRFVRGADFVTVTDERVAAVERYYDREALTTLDERLETGTCVRVRSARRTIPGAIGVTWQEAPTEAGRERVRGISEEIVRELPDTPGFIGGIVANVGDRFLTVTAWEDPNDPFQLIRTGAHRMAAVQFFGPELYTAGWTGVWTPTRLHTRWVRCAACQKMADSDRGNGRCGCGAELPEAPAYW